jgi:hypothetical protein
MWRYCPVKHGPRICEECRDPFVPRCRDAITCSARCWKARYRRKRAPAVTKEALETLPLNAALNWIFGGL